MSREGVCPADGFQYHFGHEPHVNLEKNCYKHPTKKFQNAYKVKRFHLALMPNAEYSSTWHEICAYVAHQIDVDGNNMVCVHEACSLLSLQQFGLRGDAEMSRAFLASIYANICAPFLFGIFSYW